jgi:CelD/BcsL family acetyltransferase involved in cellulose biosynthesis
MNYSRGVRAEGAPAYLAGDIGAFSCSVPSQDDCEPDDNVDVSHGDVRNRGKACAAPPGAGRRRRRRDSSQLSTDLLDSWSALEAIRAEWIELYRRTAARNPYASPEWLLPWAHHFVAERDLAVVTVRRNDQLIGVAPWHTRRLAGVARSLQLMGSGRHDSLTELPQVLTAMGESRSVLRAVVGFWSKRVRAWDWIEIPLLAEQGWFEPEWLSEAGSGGIIQQKTTRPAVVLALPGHGAQLTNVFKRNLVESIHRGRNRLNRTGKAWEITSHTRANDLDQALSVLATLHGQRANIAGRRRHPDNLADPHRIAFLRDALSGMARHGEVEILTLDVDGEPVAAQLVLKAPDCTYMGISGVDPNWWNTSPVTLLQMHAAETAVDQGHSEFNLSVGPSVAKLRWSENIAQHPEFIVCGPRRRSKILFTAFRIASLVASIRRESRRHRVTKPSARSLRRKRKH